jgi:hypothetical protein
LNSFSIRRENSRDGIICFSLKKRQNQAFFY